MKLLFLDIDGVLNNDTTKERLWNGCTGINKRLLKMFQDWHALHADVQIVLSSTWRNHPGCMAELAEHGLMFYDQTVRFCSLSNSEQLSYKQDRGHEIAEILGRCQHFDVPYVILDDMDPGVFLPDQRSRLVQTSFVHGLRAKDIRKIDRLFGHL